MDPYSYKKLDIEREEIRLIQLQPGNLDDEISFVIFHASLNPPKKRLPSARLSLVELQETLSDGWRIKENPDGRYLFCQPDKEPIVSSWDHPDKDYDRARYEQAKDDYLPGPGYEPKYEALSYTWASTLDSRHALVLSATSDLRPVAEMQIGGNLASALQHLRYKDKSRVFWIDALCIDQKDEEERDFQVKRMGSIYSLAKRVVVWLGPEGDDSTHALSTLRYFGDQVELTVDNSICNSPGAIESYWYWPFTSLPYDERTWESLSSLFNRKWFNRVWVMQEVALANRDTIVHCGSYSLPWLTLRKAMGVLGTKRGIPRNLMSLLQPHSPGIPSSTQRTLPRLLSFVRHRECTDQHDKVYGILSLMSPSLAELIQPQYLRPPYQAFKNSSLAHLEVTKRLELLQFCLITERCPDGPSWVPNWAAVPTKRLFGFRTAHFRQASGHSAAQFSCPSEDTLEVTGVRCAHVESVGQLAIGNVNEIFKIIRTWEPEGLESGDYVAGGSILNAFLEAVFQGCLKNRWPGSESWPTLSELNEAYRAVISRTATHENILKYLENGVADGAEFFTTKEGYFGVAQRGVSKADVVCVFLGCDMPMLIRPASSGSFLVVGFCFIPGLMDGESLLGLLPEEWELQLAFQQGWYVPTYINTSTHESQSEDPRLQRLQYFAPEWEKISRKRTQDDPYFLQYFQHKQTGNVMNSDPRLLRANLKQHNVRLESFRLI